MNKIMAMINNNKKVKRITQALFLAFFFVVFVCYFSETTVYANNTGPLPNVSINLGSAESPNEVSSSLELLFVLSIITLSPFILLMLTSFTRIIIALHFLRSALGTQQMPPNQVIIGISLFLTMFLMAGTFTDINENALKPYRAGTITQEQALTRGMQPIREFMIRQVDKKDIDLFANLAGKQYESKESIPNTVLMPAFIIGEVTKGFQFGVMVYMPFIVIDMVVSSTLMAMGMMMLPPAMISLPFKILLFISIGGWNKLIEYLVRTFV